MKGQKNGKSPLRHVILGTIVLAGALLYGRTLQYPFAFDCWTYIQNNPLITDLSYFLRLVDLTAFARLEDQLGLPGNVLADFLLRPLSYLTFAANYLVHGLHPSGFRAVNIALHLLNALLLFRVLERLLDCSPQVGNSDSTTVRFVPAFAAALFLLHPLQTEAVTYIVQRSTVLVTCFCLVTLLLYLCSRSEQSQARRRLFRWGSVTVLFLGMFVKESMFTVPLILLLAETVILQNTVKSSLRNLMPHLMTLPVVPLLVFAAGSLDNASAAVPAGILNTVNYAGYSPVHYAITQLCVVVSYLRLLLLPVGQNLDPDYPLYTSLLQGRPLAAFLLLAFVMLMPVLLFKRRRHDVRSSLVLFGTGWFFLGLTASSSIVPLPDLMAESRIYGPSIGFFITSAALLDWLRDSCRVSPVRKLFVPAAIVLAGVYGTATWARNDVWRSNITLWQDTVAKSPNKERPWHNLGMAYMDEIRYGEAINCFNNSLRLNPAYVKSYEALVMAFTREGRLPEAEAAAVAGIKIAPDNAVLHNNLGVVYAESGRKAAARQEFAKALQLRPGYENARMNLERSMADQDR